MGAVGREARGGWGREGKTGGRNSRSREEINPNVLSLGMAGHPRTLMDSSPAALWVVHSGAVRFLVPSCPQPIRPSQSVQTQRGGKEPYSSLACGMSRWMMNCPRVLRGALCAQKVSLCPLWGEERGTMCWFAHGDDRSECAVTGAVTGGQWPWRSGWDITRLFQGWHDGTSTWGAQDGDLRL